MRFFMRDTSKHIMLAFISLLENKSLQKITVTDIVKEANISRATFYSYFNNKDDVIEYTIEKHLNDITLILSKNLLFKEPILIEMLTFILENRVVFDAWVKYYPNIDSIITTYIKEMILNSDIVDLDLQLRQGYQVSEKFALDLYVMTTKSIILNWITHGYEETPEEVARIIHLSVRI